MRSASDLKLQRSSSHRLIEPSASCSTMSPLSSSRSSLSTPTSSRSSR
jgi:hypothetical protein